MVASDLAELKKRLAIAKQKKENAIGYDAYLYWWKRERELFEEIRMREFSKSV